MLRRMATKTVSGRIIFSTCPIIMEQLNKINQKTSFWGFASFRIKLYVFRRMATTRSSG